MLAKDCAQSCCGDPIDNRVVRKLSERYPLDSKYLEFVSSCHGAEPKNVAIKVGDRTVSVAKFLTLLDFESELSKPFRPHVDINFRDKDERAMSSIDYILNWDHHTNHALFMDLVPFAAVTVSPYLDRCYVDLFCFDYRKKVDPVGVVLWNAMAANDHVIDRDMLPIEEQISEDGNEFINMDWDSFLEPVADSFEQFAEKLFKNP